MISGESQSVQFCPKFSNTVFYDDFTNSLQPQKTNLVSKSLWVALIVFILLDQLLVIMSIMEALLTYVHWMCQKPLTEPTSTEFICD